MSWSRRKKITAIGAAAVVALIGFGVANSGVGSDSEAEPPAVVQTLPQADDASVMDAVDEAATKASDAATSTGRTYTWDNGLSVRVSRPEVFEPSEWAAGTDGVGTAVRMTVTVTNRTGEPYDASLDYMTVQSGNREAEQIFDSENGLMGPPSTKVLDGRTVSYDVAFQVQDHNDLVVEFQPGDWSLDSVLFETK